MPLYNPPSGSLLHPSRDTTGAADTANILAALGSGPASLTPGNFYTTGLALPPGAVLQGWTGQAYYSLGSSVIPNPALVTRLILASGASSAILSPNDSGSNYATAVNIRDLMLDCNGSTQGAINLPNGSAIQRFWTVERCYATNMTGSGSCVYVGTGNAGFNIRDSSIWNGQSGSAAGGNGLEIGATDSNVDHCWLGFWGTYGLKLDGGASSMSCNVKGGGIFGNGFAGVGALGSGLVLDGVSIDGNYNAGVYIAYGSSPPTTISNCEFHGNSTGGGSNIYIVNPNLVLNLHGNYAYADGSTPLPVHMIDTGGNTGLIINQAANYGPAAAFSGGWTNYTGTISAPSFPATTVAAVNNTGADVQAFIANGTGAITAIQVGATTTGMTIAASGTAAIRIPNGQSITFTYASGSPSWTWVIG